ncbi:hypothetical protein DMENIID0001_035580 [Sergentomyia squamirostris]
MSTGGGKKGAKGAGKRAAAAADKTAEDVAGPAAAAGKVLADVDAAKDDASSDADKRDKGTDGDGAVAKPQSAGASTRDAATKVLNLALKGEWTPVEQTLKALEKSIAAAGEDANSTPLAGIMDPTTGMTPLMMAVKDNRTSILDRLIDLGSDVGARNNDNYNVLHIAAMYSREDVVKLLLNKRGVDPFSTGGSRQQTPVHLVASRQTGTATSILRALLAAAGKDIRLKVDGVSNIFALFCVSC